MPNAETRAAAAQLERRENRSFDSVAELLADLNAGMERYTGFAVLACRRVRRFDRNSIANFATFWWVL